MCINDALHILLLSVLIGIPTSYITRLLWLDSVPKGFEGFIVFKNKFVYIEDGDETHVQRLAWTDYIRQFLFRVYKIEGNIWRLKINRQGIVRCTFCLSFWISLAPALVIVYSARLDFYYFFVVHLTIASVSAYLSDRM